MRWAEDVANRVLVEKSETQTYVEG